MIRVIVNPAAGRGRGAKSMERIRALAARAGATVEAGTSAHDVTARSRRAVDDGVERLLVAGGDGTVHAAVQALAGTACILGVLPLGRGNDLAGAMGWPRRLDEAFSQASSSPARTIDLGCAGGRFFTTVAGVGLDGEVVARVDRASRYLGGTLAYPFAAATALAGFVPPRLRVKHDTGVFEGPVVLAAIANTSRFGAGMRIAPAADPADGWIDLIIVRAVATWRLLSLLPRVYLGTHVRHPAVCSFRTRRVEVSSDRPIVLQADGEVLADVGASPVIVEVRPRALRVASWTEAENHDLVTEMTSLRLPCSASGPVSGRIGCRFRPLVVINGWLGACPLSARG